MHGLSAIVRMNREAAAACIVENETNRHCSFAGNAKDGVVLHSAKHRNTVFLRPGRQAAAFVAKWYSVNGDGSFRDKLVESYF